MAIKALFLDIDGTLVPFDATDMRPSTKAALEEAHRRGVASFIVTGRYKDSIGMDASFDFDGYATANGEYCFMVSGEVISSKPMPEKCVAALVERLRERGLSTSFTEPDALYFCGDPDELARSLRYKPGHEVRSWDDVDCANVLQIVVDVAPEADEELLGGIDGLENVRWSPNFLDIVSAGCGKGDAIDAFCARLGITPAECMAIGDGGNDVHMLRHAGIGVAMGQASDDVKTAADVIAPSVDEDGAVWAIRKYVLEG